MSDSTIDLIDRLRKRAAIRRQISTRKSVQEGKADRIADILDEAATALEGYMVDNARLNGHILDTNDASLIKMCKMKDMI